jgi:hypothetical protein
VKPQGPHDQREQDIDPLDTYLDGQMQGPERDEFERLSGADTDLGATVEAQRRIDGALTRLFDPPEASSALEAIQAAARRGPVRRTRWWLKAAQVAAMAAAVSVMVYAFWDLFADREPVGRGGYTVLPKRSLIDEYRYQVGHRNMVPAWVCPPRQFATNFYFRLGQAVQLATAAGVEPLGISYGHNLSPGTLLVLARVEGRPVIVFADRLANDAGPNPPPGDDTDLRRFRRVIDDLVFYELTPFDEARVLDHLQPIDMPQEWIEHPLMRIEQ